MVQKTQPAPQIEKKTEPKLEESSKVKNEFERPVLSRVKQPSSRYAQKSRSSDRVFSQTLTATRSRLSKDKLVDSVRSSQLENSITSFNKQKELQSTKKPEVAMSKDFAQYAFEDSNMSGCLGSALDIQIDTGASNKALANQVFHD